MISHRFFLKIFTLTGGCLLPSLFLCLLPAVADTILLKNGKELKGLVVEKHLDRIILSTERGEIQILLSGIKDIKYDDAERSFYEVGKAYEAQSKWGEALAYYEKALSINPNFNEAQQAAMGMRNRFWAAVAEGPRSEIEKKQELYDTGARRKPLDEIAKTQKLGDSRLLREGLGIGLEEKDNWVRVVTLDPKKPGAQAGLKRQDRLVSMDGESLRYLSPEVLTKKLLLPRFSNFTLEIERQVRLEFPTDADSIKTLGLHLKLEYAGLMIKSARPDSAAAQAGLKTGDLVTGINGKATRYLPIKKALQIIQESKGQELVFTIQRPVLLARR